MIRAKPTTRFNPKKSSANATLNYGAAPVPFFVPPKSLKLAGSQPVDELLAKAAPLTAPAPTLPISFDSQRKPSVKTSLV
jgi:hypothetical protein